METSVMNATRNVPATLTGDVEKLGFKFLRALDRLGFIHQTQDGRATTVRFASVACYGTRWAAYQIDAERLYHWSIRDLTCQRVLAQLNAISMQAGRGRVRADDRRGVYVVEMTARPKAEPAQSAPLDLHVNFDLASMPAGDLMIPIGQTANGARFEPLTRIKHLMVIGESGSGKSNFLKAALTALIKTSDASTLRVAIVSPKQAEFAAFQRVEHMWNSAAWDGHIACEADDADKLVLDLRNEFKRRDRLFSGAGVTNLDDYARKTGTRLPRVFVLVDELLDLAEMAKPAMKERMMGHLASLLSIGRSHGFHIFIGITKPHFKTLPTSITGNIDNRIAFRVATRRVAQDFEMDGAETILESAKGRGLARLYGEKLFFQAFLVSDSEQPGEMPHERDGRLSAEEAELVRYAVGELGGAFTINKLAEHFAGWTHHRVRTLADRLEADGLLTHPTSRTVGRLVTDDLAKLAAHESSTDDWNALFTLASHTQKA